MLYRIRIALKYIVIGNMEVKMDTITIKDVAKICGVGVSTVSRAINNKPGINEETKNKILSVIKENNYIPNNSARNLKRSETNNIAVLVKGINNLFFSPVITELEREIEKKKYTFILQHVDENQDEIEVAIELEKEKRLKGIVFLGGYFSHPKDKLKKLTVPFVLSTVGMTDNMKNMEYSSVAVDDVKESYKVVDYLCKLGHNKIAVLSAICDESIGKLRFEGYKKALSDNNIEFNEKLVYYLQSGNDRYSIQSGYNAMKRLLEEKADCTAIFASTDLIAIGACRAILENGYNIPDDYSVAGYDGLELSRFITPSLTTIRQPVENIAKETIRILFDAIDNNEGSVHKVFAGELIVGESTRKI